MKKRAVQFFSEGVQVKGELYMPAHGGEPLPAVLLCHGFSGIKELLLPSYAVGFVERGFVALTFDYRGFGESEGERGRLVPVEQMADIRNAITYLQTLNEVAGERIGLWGTSFGGANAIRVAAVDRRVKALSVQVTFASGERMVRGNLTPEAREKLDSTLRKVREREVTQNKVLRLSPDQIISDEDSKAFFSRAVEAYPRLSTKIPFSTLLHIMEHNPQKEIAALKCPVLIIGAGGDIVCPPEESEILFRRAPDPKKLVILEGCRHYGVYEGPGFEKSSGESLHWFSQYL